MIIISATTADPETPIKTRSGRYHRGHLKETNKALSVLWMGGWGRTGTDGGGWGRMGADGGGWVDGWMVLPQRT